MALTKLPNNIEVEKSVLGAMLLDRDALIEASSSLEEGDFFLRQHQIIYSAILEVQSKSLPVDLKTVTEVLINLKELDKVGGVQYLYELTESIVSLSNVKHYINIVRDQSNLRSVLLTMQGILEEYEKVEIEDISTFIGEASRKVTKAAEKRRISSFVTAGEVAEKVKQSLRTQKTTGEDGVTGMTTGYRSLNLLTLGFKKSDIIIIAARPSVGKTAFALNLAFNAAYKTDTSVAVFSLEMPAEQLMQRLLANRSCVELEKIQRGMLSKRDEVALDRAMKEMSALKLYIDDTPGIRLIDILSKARKLKMEQPDLSMIVIDYIGLITTGKKAESRQLEVSEISRSLKELARELEIPIIVLSQLSRNVDSRPGKRPVLSDLRESGSIEQDADQVFLMYRSDYYKGKSDEKAGGEQGGENQNANESSVSIVEIEVAKNRNGKTGTVELVFTKNIGRFDERAYDHEEDGE